MSDLVGGNARSRAFYERIVTGLVRDAGVAMADEQAVGVALMAVLGRRQISRSTWKTYAAAVRGALLARGFMEALVGFEREAEKAARPAPHRRPAIKFVPKNVLASILDVLGTREWKYSRHLAVLIMATSATGLRPKEWRDASLVTGADAVLEVQNGKFKPLGSVNERSIIRNARRGNGPSRSLVLERASTGELTALIREMLDWERRQPWVRVQRDIRRELKAVVKVLVERRVVPKLFLRLTPYSFRHQAAADAKATFQVDRGEAAAVLGHASARTAVASYGRPRMGRSGMQVRPSEDSVARVDNLDIGGESFTAMLRRRLPVAPAAAGAPLPRGAKPER